MTGPTWIRCLCLAALAGCGATGLDEGRGVEPDAGAGPDASDAAPGSGASGDAAARDAAREASGSDGSHDAAASADAAPDSQVQWHPRDAGDRTRGPKDPCRSFARVDVQPPEGCDGRADLYLTRVEERHCGCEVRALVWVANNGTRPHTGPFELAAQGILYHDENERLHIEDVSIPAGGVAGPFEVGGPGSVYFDVRSDMPECGEEFDRLELPIGDVLCVR